MPKAKAVAAMMKYNESLQKAGVLLALDGLRPPSMARASRSLEGSERGSWRLLDDSSEVEGRGGRMGVARPASDNEVIEVRQVQEFSDFPPDVKEAADKFPELQVQSGQRRGS